MSRYVRTALIAGLWVALAAVPARAQFRAPSAERIFGWYDTDRDGELDEDEIERVRGSLRERLEGRDDVDREEFIRLFEELQRGRDDDDDDDRDGGNRTLSTGGRSAPKLRERVTLELSSQYTPGDYDGDGQIGLHEWVEWKTLAAIGEFLALDINRDGLVTPRELAIAEKKSNGKDDGAAGTGSGSAGPARSPQTGAAPTGAPRQLDEATARIAREAFGNLDRDRDGRLSEQEWSSSQSTRARFEEAGVRLPTPADLETFLKLYPVEQRSTPDVSGESGEGGSNGESGEGRSRSRGFGRGR